MGDSEGHRTYAWLHLLSGIRRVRLPLPLAVNLHVAAKELSHCGEFKSSIESPLNIDTKRETILSSCRHHTDRVFAAIEFHLLVEILRRSSGSQ